MTARIITERGVEEVSDREFFVRMFGRPPRTDAERARDAELALAAKDCAAAMAKAPRGRDAYWERQRYDDDCRSAYAARCREIEERYAEQLTECRGDPLLGRAAA